MSIKQSTLETYINKLYEIGKVGNKVTLNKDTLITYTQINQDRAIFRVYEMDKNFEYAISKEFNDPDNPFRYIYPE